MGVLKSQIDSLMEPDTLAIRYGGVPVIYVESKEDCYIYGECWFKDRLSKLEIKPATAKCDTDGCDAVLNAVQLERQAGNSAWGIVDRDTVMSKDLWYLVHETNNDAFENAKPFGKFIKVLLRWEMESYLVDCEALEHIQAGLKQTPERPKPTVFQELLEHCCILVPHATINAVLHEHRMRKVGDGYTNRFSNSEGVIADIKKTQISKLPDSGQADYDRHLPLVIAFDSPGASVEERLNDLLRRIDGKALLERFFHATRNIQVNVKGLLATRIKERTRIPAEIEIFIELVAGTLGRA